MNWLISINAISKRIVEIGFIFYFVTSEDTITFLANKLDAPFIDFNRPNVKEIKRNKLSNEFLGPQIGVMDVLFYPFFFPRSTLQFIPANEAETEWIRNPSESSSRIRHSLCQPSFEVSLTNSYWTNGMHHAKRGSINHSLKHQFYPNNRISKRGSSDICFYSWQSKTFHVYIRGYTQLVWVCIVFILSGIYIALIVGIFLQWISAMIQCICHTVCVMLIREPNKLSIPGSVITTTCYF